MNPLPAESARTFPLVYVCKFCAGVIAEFPAVAAREPATLGVCDRAECRAAASAAYKGAA